MADCCADQYFASSDLPPGGKGRWLNFRLPKSLLMTLVRVRGSCTGRKARLQPARVDLIPRIDGALLSVLSQEKL